MAMQVAKINETTFKVTVEGRTTTTHTVTVSCDYYRKKWVSTCLDHTLHVVVGPRTPSHELTVRHGIDLYGVLKQAVEQQSTRP